MPGIGHSLCCGGLPRRRAETQQFCAPGLSSKHFECLKHQRTTSRRIRVRLRMIHRSTNFPRHRVTHMIVSPRSLCSLAAGRERCTFPPSSSLPTTEVHACSGPFLHARPSKARAIHGRCPSELRTSAAEEGLKKSDGIRTTFAA